MKGSLKILVILGLAFFAAGCAKVEEAGAYYYYFNNKIYLNEHLDMMYIRFEPDLSLAGKKAIVESDSSLKPWTSPRRLYSGGRTYDGTVGDVAVLQSAVRISKSKMRAFCSRKGVLSVSYMFDYNGDYMAVDNQFSVKLLTSDSEADLARLARKYGCSYEKWSPNDTAWDGVYTVTLPKTSTIDALRLSCIFKENGHFEWSSPHFIPFYSAFD